MTENISRADRLIAESDIARLIYTYCYLMDAGDFDAVGNLFANATWQLSPEQVTTGKTEIVELLQGAMRLYDGKPGTRHVVTNILTDVADDGLTAHSFSYIHTTQVVEGFPLQLIFQGRFEDHFTCVDGGWQFTSRLAHADGAGDMSHHQKTTV